MQARADHPAAKPTTPAAAKTTPTGTSEEARSHFAAGVSLLQDPEGDRRRRAGNHTDGERTCAQASRLRAQFRTNLD